MTPQDHNKVIGIMHLIYGGFNALIMLILVPIFLAAGGFAVSDPTAPAEMSAVLVIFGVVMLLFAALVSIPPLLAGYGMLMRKSWGRLWGIIAGCVCALSFPFGTALCVYTLWFLCGPGEHFHRGAGAVGAQDWRTPLPEASTFGWEWQGAPRAGRPHEYVPPPQPPDWRGE